jgi:hypothetical protein
MASLDMGINFEQFNYIHSVIKSGKKHRPNIENRRSRQILLFKANICWLNHKTEINFEIIKYTK